MLNCISDDKCREMLSVVKEGQTLSIAALQLTRKQFYSRLHTLITFDLIKKTRGRYHLTSFGKVIYDWYLVLSQALSEEYWKLKALDLLELSGIPSSERSKIMDSLVKNEKLRQFIKA